MYNGCSVFIHTEVPRDVFYRDAKKQQGSTGVPMARASREALPIDNRDNFALYSVFLVRGKIRFLVRNLFFIVSISSSAYLDQIM